MNTSETKTTGPADRSKSEPVYLTPEQIIAQIPPGIHTTLNPWRDKLTQNDMDRLAELTEEYLARYRAEMADAAQNS